MPRAGLVFALASVTLVAQACRTTVPSEIPPGAVALEIRAFPATAAEMLYSGSGERERRVIRDATTWAQFWRERTSHVMPSPPPPAVDFATEMVIVAAMGQRSSGGHSIHIDQVYELNGVLNAVVREVSPGSNCMVTAALTSPMTAVRVPRRDGQVTFVERTETQLCQ